MPNSYIEFLPGYDYGYILTLLVLNYYLEVSAIDIDDLVAQLGEEPWSVLILKWLTDAVIKLDWSLSKKRIVRATSSGCPIRPKAVVARKASRPGDGVAVSAVWITPLFVVSFQYDQELSHNGKW